MPIHINLVSNQILPNVLSTLMAGDIENSRVYIVQGDASFAAKANLLADFYQRKGIHEVHHFECGASMDFGVLYQKARELYDLIRTAHPDEQIVLNATCGTKPMSIAFTQVFNDIPNQSMAIYTDTDNKCQPILAPNKGALPYTSALDIDDYLYLFGYDVDSSITSFSQDHDEIIDRKDFTKWLSGRFKDVKGLLGQINMLASETMFGSKRPFIATIKPKKKLHGSVLALLERCQQQGLVTEYDPHQITFANEESARYLGGAWLEEYVYLCALDAGIEHVAMSVEAYPLDDNNQRSKTFNELDLVMVHNNHFLVVECKTINWKSEYNKGKAQDVVQKLENLTRNLGGAHAKGWLLSVNELTDSGKERIGSLRVIEQISGNSWREVGNRLSQWRKQVS